MNITGPLIVLIANNATAATLTDGKVYPVVAPQTTVPPYVVMRIIEVQPTQHKDGVSPLDAVFVQVSTLAKDYHYAQRTDEAVRRSIDGYCGNVTVDGDPVPIDGTQYLTGQDLFEDEPQLFRRDATYKVRLRRDGTTVSGGTPGSSTDFSIIEVQAGQALSTGRAIIIDGGQAFYFQPSDAAHAGRIVGITRTSAASAGVSVSVQISGIVSDPAFTFTVDKGLYAIANGQITSTKPNTAAVQYVGVSTAANTMKIEFTDTLQLS